MTRFAGQVVPMSHVMLMFDGRSGILWFMIHRPWWWPLGTQSHWSRQWHQQLSGLIHNHIIQRKTILTKIFTNVLSGLIQFYQLQRAPRLLALHKHVGCFLFKYLLDYQRFSKRIMRDFCLFILIGARLPIWLYNIGICCFVAIQPSLWIKLHPIKLD